MDDIAEKAAGSYSRSRSALDTVIDTISSVFLPIVNLLSATGILKGVLAILTTVGILAASSGTYNVLNAMGDSLFYFFPILLVYTSAKKFGANQYTAVVIAGVVLYPSLTSVFNAGHSVSFLGLPATAVNYPHSVIPIILAVGLLHYVEKICYKVLPDMIKGFLTPLLCLLIVGAITLWVLGPIGTVIGNALAAGYSFLYNLSPIVAGICLGGLIQIMVIFGFHWGLVPIAMSNIAATGHDTILTFFAPAVFAQAGAALGVCIRSKSKAFKTVALSAAISACFGITEPALFGVNLPLKKPMVAVCLAGAIGGGLAGFSGASAMSFAFPGLATLPIFLGKGFGLFVVACLMSMVLAFVLTLVMRFDMTESVLEKADTADAVDVSVPLAKVSEA